MPGFFINLWAHLSYFLKDFYLFIIFYFIFFGVFLGAILILKKKQFWLSTLLINLTIFLFLIINLFYGLELYFRYIFDQTDNIFQIKTTQRWVQRHVVINAFSFREEHFFDEKAPEEIRIGVLGDSYTWGYGIEDEKKRYGDLLEEKLNNKYQSKGKSVKVYTLALPGMSTKEHFQYLNDFAKKYKFDALVLGYYMDDGGSERTARHIEPCYNLIFSYRYLPLVRTFIDNSYALEYFYIRFYNRFIFPRFADQCWTFAYEKQYQDPELWVRHLKRLYQIINYSKENNMKLAVLIIPYMKFIGPDYPARKIHENLSQFFQANQIPLVDLLSVYSAYKPEDLMVSRYDFHANELAHQLAAEELFKLF